MWSKNSIHFLFPKLLALFLSSTDVSVVCFQKLAAYMPPPLVRPPSSQQATALHNHCMIIRDLWLVHPEGLLCVGWQIYSEIYCLGACLSPFNHRCTSSHIGIMEKQVCQSPQFLFLWWKTSSRGSPLNTKTAKDGKNITVWNKHKIYKMRGDKQ